MDIVDFQRCRVITNESLPGLNIFFFFFFFKNLFGFGYVFGVLRSYYS